MHQANRGFTLIEMMMTLAIMGIILSIAIPSYRQYVIRSNRAAVQAEVMQIASLVERYKSRQLTYQGANLNLLYGPPTGRVVFPRGAAAGKELYTLALSVPTNGASWILKAMPEGTQFGDGALSLDSAGRRCWNKSDQNNCDLSNPAQAWSVR